MNIWLSPKNFSRVLRFKMLLTNTVSVDNIFICPKLFCLHEHLSVQYLELNFPVLGIASRKRIT